MASGGAKTAVSAEDLRYWRHALFGAFAVTLLRLFWLAHGGADLYPDEAQYWLWSLHPDWGYYSKPPVVAWLIALTTYALGDNEAAIRLSAPLLHFATALVIFHIAKRLFDSRTGFWSALAYITLPGASVSAVLISTDAPLLLCWAAALYAFIRAREEGGGLWWYAVGAAAGLGLLSKYAMVYWLVSGLLYLLLFRDERRHLAGYGKAAFLALLIYLPNFFWNLGHGFVSYRHTEENAASHGSLIHPMNFVEFFLSQFGVFGPVFAAVLLLLALTMRKNLAPRPAALLAVFALPTLAMMLVVSFISHAQPNWSAPAYVSAVVLVVAWLLHHGRRAVVAASIGLNVAIAVVGFTAHDAAQALGYNLPGRFDPLHRLRGWHQLGLAVSQIMDSHPGALLLCDEREDMAILTYYVFPHPFVALKWNGESGRVNDQFDLEADPQSFIGKDFVLVSHHPDNIQRIIDRFDSAGPVDHVTIPLGGGDARVYVVRFLQGFKGYVEKTQ